jgi:small ligand-binding sensory domain FIST
MIILHPIMVMLIFWGWGLLLSLHSRYAQSNFLLPNYSKSVQTGLISFILGFFRLGFIDVVLSRALLHGFIAAVAVIIMM